MKTAQPADASKLLKDLVSHQKERPTIRAAGIEALGRLVPVALRETGQSRVVGRFLLGLYNAADWPFALTDLRVLDANLFDDCLAVLRLDHTPEQEVHQYLPRGQIFNQLREYWG